jgi:hypothetical protein
LGLIKPYVTITGMRITTKIFKMTQIISIEEYHRLKSHHPKRTTRGQLTRVPHICESNNWRTSPHCGKQCWNCVEVTKIIEFENRMEEKYQNRQHTLHPCYCHWCRNRLRQTHETCITCNPEEEEIIKPIINKGKAHDNNLLPQDWSETSFNEYYFPYDYSNNENNSITSIPWSQSDSDNIEQQVQYSTEWFRKYWAKEKTQPQIKNTKKISTLPLRIEKYTVLPKQKNKHIETGTNDHANQFKKQQKNQWNSCDTAQIVELNTTIWRMGMIIGSKYGSTQKDLHNCNIPQRYHNPNFL